MKSYHRLGYLQGIKTSLQKEKLVLLCGQRQVGKTTLMHLLLEDADLTGPKYYFSFEDTMQRTFENKQSFLDMLEFSLGIDFSQEGIVFLDEVQYIPTIVSLLKALYDDTQIRTKIVATGSGMRNIPMQAGSSLVGRGEEITVHPFSFAEFVDYKTGKGNFLDPKKYTDSRGSLLLPLYEEYLTWGGYPEVIKAGSPRNKQHELEKIVRRFFEKDVMFRFTQKEMIEFEKIYYYLYQNIGNLIKIERIATALGVGTKMVMKFFTFLKRSLVIFEVKPFFTDKSKEVFSQPEMFLSDLGILSWMSKHYGDKKQDGKVIENFVFLELIKNVRDSEIKYYHKKNGTEIDFIIEKRDGSLIPVEVKSGDSLATPRAFYGFGERFGGKIEYFIKTSMVSCADQHFDKYMLRILPNFLVGSVGK